MIVRDVSVVVPVWREFDDLRSCLEALDSQSIRPRMEVVVSVDGTEPIPDWIGELADNVVQGKHAGPASARNRGWRNSKGRFVLFTDSDCIPKKDWAEKLVMTLENGADAVKGVYSHGGSRIIQRLAQVEFRERYRILWSKRSIDMVDTYAAGYRRRVLEESGGFDESFPMPDHEDVDLSYRMAEMGFRLEFQPGAQVGHRHRQSWAGYFRMKHGRGFWRARILRKFPSRAGSDSYTPWCLKLQIILCFLLPPAILALPISTVPLISWAAVFLLSTIPLSSVAFASDRPLLPLIPPFALWRGCALSSGLIRGIFGSERTEG